MAKIGVNTFLWTSTWENGIAEILGKARHMGFDCVQIPLLSLDILDAGELARTAKEVGLECYISAGLRDSTDVTSDEEETRRRGVEYLKGCVRFAHEVGAPFLSGSFHSVFGKKAYRPVTDIEWRNSAESLKEVALEAQEFDLALVLEPINRYESFLINTAEQAVRLIEMIGEPNVQIQLDTFHMNLEEDSFRGAIELAREKLTHFHVAENHRGRFGHGTMPWEEVFGALKDIDYKGAIVIETFMPEVADVALAAAIWRKMAPCADEMAREGLEFMRDCCERFGLD
ncbi:sugar phosphate isomerase/epimerase family protein [Candidatus Hydrogenedentota bacterium]